MVYETLAFTLDIIGKVLIAIAVIMVHSKVVRERKIDKRVLRELQHEKIISIAGIILMILGYLLHVIPLSP